MFNAALKILCTFFSSYFFKKMQRGNFYQVSFFISNLLPGPCSLHISLELKILGDFVCLFENLHLFV